MYRFIILWLIEIIRNSCFKRLKYTVDKYFDVLSDAKWNQNLNSDFIERGIRRRSVKRAGDNELATKVATKTTTGYTGKDSVNNKILLLCSKYFLLYLYLLHISKLKQSVENVINSQSKLDSPCFPLSSTKILFPSYFTVCEKFLK